MVAHNCNTSRLTEVRQEDLKFRENLYYTVKPFLMNSTNNICLSSHFLSVLLLSLKTFPIIRACRECHCSYSIGCWQTTKLLPLWVKKSVKRIRVCGGWVLICLTTICSRTGWRNLGDHLKGPSGNKETGCASTNKFSSLSSHLTHQRGLSYLSDIDKLHKLLSVICITINTGHRPWCVMRNPNVYTLPPQLSLASQ